MSGKGVQKYPKVGIFLIVESHQSKWLWDISSGEPSLPFKELLGGESWEGAVNALKEELQLKRNDSFLSGMGSGRGEKGVGWTYSVFHIKEVREMVLPGFEWIDPEKANPIQSLSLEIKKNFLSSHSQT